MNKYTRIIFSSILIFRFAFLPILPCFSASNELNIPSLLSVPVIFKYPVTSNQIKTGDVIPVSVNEDVYVDQTLIFKKGTDGVAFIENSKNGRSWGRGGKIEITSGRINDVFGNEHTVKISTQAQGDSKASGKILPIVSLVVCWPLAFFGFKKGDEAVIPAGKLVYAFTTSPLSVNISKR